MLHPHHLDDLRCSGLSDATIAGLGFHSGTADEVKAILGFNAGPGLVIPYPDPFGVVVQVLPGLSLLQRDNKHTSDLSVGSRYCEYAAASLPACLAKHGSAQSQALSLAPSAGRAERPRPRAASGSQGPACPEWQPPHSGS